MRSALIPYLQRLPELASPREDRPIFSSPQQAELFLSVTGQRSTCNVTALWTIAKTEVVTEIPDIGDPTHWTVVQRAKFV